MVNIILCGTAGTRKHMLIEELKRRCKAVQRHVVIENIVSRVLDRFGIRCGRDFSRDDRKYEAVQKAIIRAQSDAELQCQSEYITDNCIVGSLVHIYMCLADETALERISSMPNVNELLKRYQSSLVILLCYNSKHGQSSLGLQCRADKENTTEIKKAYREILDKYSIPFLEIGSSDLDIQMKVLNKGILCDIPLYTATLENYESQKKVDQGKQTADCVKVQKTFSFFRKSSHKEQTIQIPTIIVKEQSYEQIWTSYSTRKTNRFISVHGHENLACIEFQPSIRSTRVQKTLLNGLRINGELYTFLGCSSGGMKKRKCFLWKGKEEHGQKLIQALGDFSAIKTVSKRLARISLLFTEVQLTSIKIDRKDIRMIQDVVINGQTFTDGCGLIGKSLAEEIWSEIKPAAFDGYLPSVYQMRLQGYKGVLALDGDTTNKDKICVRPSMEKFSTEKLPNFGICDFSMPNTFGSLNKQFIMLLSGLGIKNEIFLNKQKEYINLLESMTDNPESAIMMLQWQDNFQVAQLITRAGSIDTIPEPHKQYVLSELKNLQQHLKGKVEKLSILIPESRNLFGICDPISKLEYGECFLRLTLSGKPMSIRGNIVVCKNPCYLTGDVRVLKAVTEADKPGLKKIHHLLDCIVFPCKGKRPHSAEIAGSDLDGDKYFVCWDKVLIPTEVRPPYGYPSVSVKREGEVTMEKMIEYFARQNETGKLMGRINNYFIRWADEKGVSSDECERLGQLFSRAVDAVKTGDALDIPMGLVPPTSNFDNLQREQVWQIMLREATKYKERFAERLIKEIKTNICQEFALEIISYECSNISEFEKFKFAFLYLQNTPKPDMAACIELFMDKYYQFIDFGKFTIIQKREAVLMGFPKCRLLNALMKSLILSETDLHHFFMDSPQCRWNHLLSKYQDEFDWRHLLKALTTYDKILLVFEMPDGVIIQLQFHERQTVGKEIVVDPGTVTAILISKHFGYRNKYVVGPSFYIDLTEDTIQLYRDKKVDRTLIWLKATDRKANKGRWNKAMSDEIVNSVSMDIQRFPSVNSKGRHPLINKIPFVGIELYAQKAGGEAAYWDIYDANIIDDVPEKVPTETNDEQDFISLMNLEDLFPVISFDEDIEDDTSGKELQQVYEKVCETCNPFVFLSLFEKYPFKSAEVLDHFIALLENVSVKVVPFQLPESVCVTIENTTLNIIAELEASTNSVISHCQIIKLTCCLCRLYMPKTAQHLINRLGDKVSSSTDSYLESLEILPSIWALDLKMKQDILRLLYLSLGEETDTIKEQDMNDSISDADYTKNLKMYLRKYAFLLGLHLVHDMHTKSSVASVTDSLTYLKLDRTCADETLLTFYKTSAVSVSDSFLIGQFVTISLQKLVQDGPSIESVCASGVIDKLIIAPLSITIKIDHKIPSILQSALKNPGVKYWQIDIVGNIVSYKRCAAAMKFLWMDNSESSLIGILSSRNEYRQSKSNCCESEQPDSRDEIYPISAISENLNQDQNTAVVTALKEKICLIQGPPGTGKTSVACSIVKRVVEENTYKGVLIVAETNAAVDNLARRLRNDLLILRLGSTTADDLYDVTLEGNLRNIAAKEARKTDYRDEFGEAHRNPKLVKRIISSADAVLATCIAAGELSLVVHTFEFVIVDEATKVMETNLLCTLTHGAKHLVMIGDHKQLGPLVPDNPSLPDLDGCPSIRELSQSLFHQCLSSVPKCVLETQYRMHPKLMEFPSAEFYDNRLKASESTKKRDPVEFDWPAGKHVPVCFINVEGEERRQGSSYINEKEIEMVQKVIKRLLNCNYVPSRKDDRPISVEEIGVLTLYQGQEKALRQHVSRSITVKSVDGFQGQERDVIIVSTVRCNDRRSVGFSGDANRINVLLTRSKRGLIIIGNRRTIEAAPIWEKWLSNVTTLDLSN